MFRICALIGFLMLALTFQVRADTHDPLAVYRAEVNQALDALNDEFSMARARGRVIRAFGNAEVDFSRRYIDRWSGLIFQRFARMRLFFEATDARLTEWQLAVAAGEVPMAEAVAALDRPMAQTMDVAARMPHWLSDDIDRMTERAFWTDLAHQVGCCDALYYHVLEEAELVWSASESPNPATIADLQLLPPVGATDFDAALLAYEGLVARLEAMIAEGVDGPVARRAALNEALLFRDLFGGAPYTNANLDNLAMREDFAARPVGPLLSLAAITEPGSLRDTLLRQSSLRLEARAAVLHGDAPAMVRSIGPANQGTSAVITPQSDASVSLGGIVADPAPMPAPSPNGAPAPATMSRAEQAVNAALVAMQDGSQSGLMAAARAAHVVDDLLIAGDTVTVLSAAAPQ